MANAIADWLNSDRNFVLFLSAAGLATAVIGRWSVRYLRSCRVPVVLSSRGELAEAPDIESISEDEAAVDAVLIQTCCIHASGLTGPDTAVLRAGYLRMSEDDRYDLDLTFAALVTPEDVEP